ncbi:hypothetical protein DL764_004664 [Monosporascus ibericus]|uniref:Zona occludens toxin N-terminal domain-containing protein n=1 Tax=Monosporascus ibericus TaxID=155417 RepID=A0A4Q4TFD5_9PEZI|nr:hypothetical protein DL764_004664 [Monosporascus ibericus]
MRASNLPGATITSSNSSPGDGQLLTKRLRLLERKGDLDGLDEIRTAPIFTESARQRAVDVTASSDSLFSQYGVIAGSVNKNGLKNDCIFYYNVAVPSSTFICGSQGSGKSHTLCCLLENCLIPSDANELPRPLTGIVFHYDTFINDSGGSPCEAAFLSTHPDVSVRVLCPPTNVAVIRKTYSQFPNVKIEELRINQTDLNTKRMMDLMAVKEGGNMPLYLHVVSRILRELRLEQQATNSTFKYAAFSNRIRDEPLTVAQRNPLIQRLDTLESFMVEEQVKASLPSLYGNRKQKGPGNKNTGNDWTPKSGQLTIVDLSCPCVTAETACSLFNICLSLFIEQEPSVGRIVALDEAHKYMNESAEAGTLTEQLLATIRLQRHLGARVVISTQEPTVSPKLLDLCSMTIVHRFTSPDWLNALQRHLAGISIVSRLREKANGTDDDAGKLADGFKELSIKDTDPATAMFAHIVQLKVGEALVFAPSAVLGVDDSFNVKKLSHGVLKVRIRNRVTEDGGRSVMAG